MRRLFASASRPALLRFAALLILVASGLLLVALTPLGDLLSEQGITALITEARASWWAPLLLILLYVTVATMALPPVPLLVGGALFGALWGSIYNLTGLFLGALSSYHFARRLGRDAIVQWTGQRLGRAERAFERHGFWPLVQTRFLPLPFPLVNFGAALAGVPPMLFLTTSLLGLAPSTAIHTYFIAELIDTRGRERAWAGAAYLGSFIVFNLLIGIPWWRQRLRRRRQYLRLLAQRAARRN